MSSKRDMVDDDEDYEDTSKRRRSSGGNRRDEECVKKMCIGSGLCAIISGICAILCMIIAFSIDQLTDNVAIEDGIDLGCGWNKPYRMGSGSGRICERSDCPTWTELCDECDDDDCANCTNKFAGQIWLMCGLLSFFLTIITIILTLLFWLCYEKCECLNCWLKVLYAVCLAFTLSGIISYVALTGCDECCYDGTGRDEPIIKGSQWAGGIAALFQVISVVCSCGLGYGFD